MNIPRGEQMYRLPLPRTRLEREYLGDVNLWEEI